MWDEKRWSKDSTGEVFRLAKDTVASIYGEAQVEDEEERKRLARWALQFESGARIRAMVSLAQSEPGVPVSPDQLDSDPWLLNCENGTVDLRTGRLRPHGRGDLITKLAPVKYDPDAPCGLWESFLEAIMDHNESTIEFLKRAVGYSLTGDTSEQVMFFLYGTGSNGKSTFLDVISSLLGDYAQHTPTETLMVKRNDAIPNTLLG